MKKALNETSKMYYDLSDELHYFMLSQPVEFKDTLAGNIIEFRIAMLALKISIIESLISLF